MPMINESAPEGAEKEAKRPTLQDIRNNPDQWRLLGVYCESQKGEEVFKRLEKGESNETDIETLSKLRDGFLDREADIGKTQEQLTDETIARVAELSDDLRAIAKINGSYNIRPAIMRHLSETGMAGGTAYKEMSESLAEIAAEKASMEKETKRAITLAAEHGISKEEYLGALANMQHDPEALKKTIVGNLNPWRHPFQVAGLDAEAIRQKVVKLDNRNAVAQSKAKLEELEGSLGTALRSVVFKNEPIRKSFFSGFAKPKESNDEVVAAEPIAEPVVDSESVERAPAPVSTAAPAVEAVSKQPMAEAAPKDNQEQEKQEFKVGDFALWEQKGTLMFKEPKRIVEISEDLSSHKKFAIFEGQKGGVPLGELIVPSGEDIAELIKSLREGELVFGDAEFKEAQKMMKEKLPEDLTRKARQGWPQYRAAHEHDEGFTDEIGRADYSRELAKEAFSKEKISIWNIVKRLFLQDKIESSLKYS